MKRSISIKGSLMGLPVIVFMILFIGTVNANAGSIGLPFGDCTKSLFRGVSGVVGYDCDFECQPGNVQDSECHCYTNQGPYNPITFFFTAGPFVSPCACFGHSDFLCSNSAFAQWNELFWYGLFKVSPSITSNGQEACKVKCVRSDSCTQQCVSNQPSPP